MENSQTLNYPALYAQFKREKQYLDNVSSATVEGYGWAWKAFGPAFERTVSITKADVVAQVARLRERGLTPVTINTYLRSVNTSLLWMHNEGHCAASLKVPRLKEERKIIEAF